MTDWNALPSKHIVSFKDGCFTLIHRTQEQAKHATRLEAIVSYSKLPHMCETVNHIKQGVDEDIHVSTPIIHGKYLSG